MAVAGGLSISGNNIEAKARMPWPAASKTRFWDGVPGLPQAIALIVATYFSVYQQ